MSELELSNKTCSACHAGAPQVTETELKEALTSLPDWSVVTIDGVQQLTRLHI